MRRTLISTTALAAATALLLAPATGATAGSKHAKRFTCSLQLNVQGPPQGSPPAATSLGFVACPAPFGDGVHHSTAVTTPTSPGNGTVVVNFKNYYDRGTTNGTVAGTFTASSPTDITYTGTVTYLGGTGKFRHVRGGGTIQCTSSDGGAHKACTVNTRLTGV
jgi:hypothetical protein